MSTVFVIPSPVSDIKSFIGWRNELPNALVSGDDIDANYPVKNLFDDLFQTDFSFDSGVGTQEIIFTWGSSVKINYFSLTSKNAVDCSMGVKFSYFDSVSQVYIDIDEFAFQRNGQPYAKYFGGLFQLGYIEVQALRVTVTSTSKPYIFSMMCGLAEGFDCGPDIGFQPGRVNPQDEVVQSITKGKKVIASRVIENGFRESFSYSILDMDKVELWMPDLQRHIIYGKYICYCHDASKPYRSFLGTQDPKNMPKLEYTHEFYTSFNLALDGFA